MKKHFLHTIIITILLCILSACSQPTQAVIPGAGNTDSTSNSSGLTFSTGWWLLEYRSSASSSTWQKVYIDYKYSKNAFNMIYDDESNTTYIAAYRNWDDVSSSFTSDRQNVSINRNIYRQFQKITESELPQWYRNSSANSGTYTTPTFSAGWWLLKQDAACEYYIYYNDSKVIQKFGYKAYTGFESYTESCDGYQSSYNWDTLASYSSNFLAFRKVSESELPSWLITKMNNNNNGGSSGGNNGGTSQTSVSLFLGTWNITNPTNWLVDSIVFNSNGTGESYNSNYASSGHNTFTWSIVNANTMTIQDTTNTPNGTSYTVTYTISANTLTLVNFYSYSDTITATK